MKYEEYTTNGNTKARSPAEIEADLADIRHEMSDTIQRLEDRFSPRALLDVAYSRARGLGEGSSEFVSNLGSTIRDNPVSVLLLAAGAVSLITAERRGSRSYDERMARGRQHQNATEGEASGESTAQAIKSDVRELGGAISDRAGELRERAQDRSVAVRDRMRGTMERARSQGSRALHEEPMVVIGIGIALGALFGAAMPISEPERRAIGPTSRRAIDRAKEAVGHGVERTRKLTERVTEQSGASGSNEPPLQPPSETQAEVTKSHAGGASRRRHDSETPVTDIPENALQEGRVRTARGGSSRGSL